MCDSSGSTFARPGGPSLQPVNPGDIVAGHSSSRSIPKVNPGAGFPPALCDPLRGLQPTLLPFERGTLATPEGIRRTARGVRAGSKPKVNPTRGFFTWVGVLGVGAGAPGQVGDGLSENDGLSERLGAHGYAILFRDLGVHDVVEIGKVIVQELVSALGAICARTNTSLSHFHPPIAPGNPSSVSLPYASSRASHCLSVSPRIAHGRHRSGAGCQRGRRTLRRVGGPGRQSGGGDATRRRLAASHAGHRRGFVVSRPKLSPIRVTDDRYSGRLPALLVLQGYGSPAARSPRSASPRTRPWILWLSLPTKAGFGWKAYFDHLYSEARCSSAVGRAANLRAM